MTPVSFLCNSSMPKKGAAARAPASAAPSMGSNVSMTTMTALSVAGKTVKGKYIPSDAEKRITKGFCGYEHCSQRLRPVDVDGDEVCLSCEDHHVTYCKGYAYKSEVQVMTDYNAGGAFREAFNNAHQYVHVGGEPHQPGSVDDKRASYTDCEKVFGMWTDKATLDTNVTL